MDKPGSKFEPMTKVKPAIGANDADSIDLKEKEPQDEPQYLEDEDQVPQEQEVTTPVAEAKPTKDAESTAGYANYSELEKPKRDYKKPLLIALGVVILGAAAAYWFVLKSKPATTSSAPTTNSSSASTAAPATTSSTPAASTITTATKTYTSPNFNLSFAYPEDWIIADAGGGAMTVKSPAISLKNAAGQTVGGQIVFTIRDKNQKLTEFDSGNSTATRDSLKIAYTKPTQTQRGNTYVSYLQYATSRTAGSLDGLYITGDNGYTKGQAVPMLDVQKVDPIVSISFVDSSAKQMSIADTMMDDTAFSAALTGILKSLSIN